MRRRRRRRRKRKSRGEEDVWANYNHVQSRNRHHLR